MWKYLKRTVIKWTNYTVKTRKRRIELQFFSPGGLSCILAAKHSGNLSFLSALLMRRSCCRWHSTKWKDIKLAEMQILNISRWIFLLLNVTTKALNAYVLAQTSQSWCWQAESALEQDPRHRHERSPIKTWRQMCKALLSFLCLSVTKTAKSPDAWDFIAAL